MIERQWSFDRVSKMLVGAAITALFLAWNARAGAAERDSVLPTAESRIDSIVEVLKAESLEDSLDNLYQVNFFTWPGGGLDGGGSWTHHEGRAVLADDAGTRDIHSILSNRRFVKLYEELKSIDRARAGELVRDHLVRALEEYVGLYEQYERTARPMFHAYKMKPDQSGAMSGPGFVIATREPTDRVLLGARYEVLSLVWLAGALGLTEVSEAVRNAALEAQAQREDLRTAEEIHQIYCDRMLEKATLYSREIVAFGLVNTSTEPEELRALMRSWDVIPNEYHSTGFDSAWSPYDFGIARPAIAELRIAITCFGRVSDEAFDVLLAKMGVEN